MRACVHTCVLARVLLTNYGCLLWGGGAGGRPAEIARAGSFFCIPAPAPMVRTVVATAHSSVGSTIGSMAEAEHFGIWQNIEKRLC